jgi:hypothetical protein
VLPRLVRRRPVLLDGELVVVRWPAGAAFGRMLQAGATDASSPIAASAVLILDGAQSAPRSTHGAHLRPQWTETGTALSAFPLVRPFVEGAPPGTRTPNPLVKSQLRCVPSYVVACRLVLFSQVSGELWCRVVSRRAGSVRRRGAHMEHSMRSMHRQGRMRMGVPRYGLPSWMLHSGTRGVALNSACAGSSPRQYTQQLGIASTSGFLRGRLVVERLLL